MKLTCNNSDYSGATTKLPKILLNGNNICMASTRVLEAAFAHCLTPCAAHPRWHARRRLMIHRCTSIFHSLFNDQQFTDRPPLCEHITRNSEKLLHNSSCSATVPNRSNNADARIRVTSSHWNAEIMRDYYFVSSCLVQATTSFGLSSVVV
jgi:hypothetical protein